MDLGHQDGGDLDHQDDVDLDHQDGGDLDHQDAPGAPQPLLRHPRYLWGTTGKAAPAGAGFKTAPESVTGRTEQGTRCNWSSTKPPDSALAEATRIDEAKDIRDKAEALEAYARQKNDIEMERWVAEIKLRAFTRIGEISRELEKAEAHVGKICLPDSGKSKAQTLNAAGISTSTAHRAEKLAEHKATVDAYIARKSANHEPVKYAEALAEVREQIGLTQSLNERLARMEGERTAPRGPTTEGRDMNQPTFTCSLEERDSIMRALLIGLSAYGEIERVRNAAELAKLSSAWQEWMQDLVPLDQTGAADTVVLFADALRSVNRDLVPA